MTPTALDIATGVSCAAGADVTFNRLTGGFHVWYGAAALNVATTTPYNAHFDATTGVAQNDIIWRFFGAHTK